jgi:hypothetical protein
MGDRKRGDAVNFAPGPAQLPVEVGECRLDSCCFPPIQAHMHVNIQCCTLTPKTWEEPCSLLAGERGYRHIIMYPYTFYNTGIAH